MPKKKVKTKNRTLKRKIGERPKSNIFIRGYVELNKMSNKSWLRKP